MKKIVLSAILMGLSALLFCRKADAAGYVAVSRHCPAYFECEGRGWLPVSVNYLPYDGDADGNDEQEFAAIEEYFRKFAENGINSIRTWISGGFFEIEHRTEGAYDPARFARIDRFLELAAKYDIKVKFTLQHIRHIASSRTPQSGWATSTALSTAFADIDDYTSTPRGRESYCNRAKALAERYKDNPSIYAWELWNEINAAAWKDNGWHDFTQQMLPRIQALFPNQLVTQTLGSLDRPEADRSYRELGGIKSNPFLSVHRYLDQAERTYEQVKGPIDRLVSTALDSARRYSPSRPVVMNEIGAVKPDHAGPSELYRKDTAGMLIHDMIFAPYFCGSAGSGSMWHYDHYIERNRLWYHFLRFATATRGIDPLAEGFSPFVHEQNGLRFYGLEGKTTTLIWCRDSANTWQSELLEKQLPTPKSGIVVPLAALHRGPRGAKAEFYDPWTDSFSSGEITAGQLALPPVSRSLVIKLQTQN